MGPRVTINGEERRLDAVLSVHALLAELGLEPVTIAVERNREIVPRSRYGEVTVVDGDKIEIVQFIGGG
jgi:thiamine biosynthesis protein ThiS